MLKSMQYAGLKTLRKCRNFFTHLPHKYVINILQKKNWSKTTNQALSSCSKKTLSRKGGHQHQLDDQHKEPIIDITII